MKSRVYRCAVAKICVLLLMFFISGAVYGESVFLKDGSIVEGKVVKGTDKTIQLKNSAGEIKTFGRDNVLRIVFDEAYKEKQYITRTDTSEVEAYIVEEDLKQYVYRTNLLSSNETAIPKSDVVRVAKAKAVKSESEIISRAAFLRAGATCDLSGTADSAFTGGLLDLFLYRARSSRGNGLDVFARGVFNRYTPSDVRDLGYDVIGASVTDATLQQSSFGTGLRLIYGDTFLGTQLQGYILGYYQFSVAKADVSYSSPVGKATVSHTYRSHGVIGGAGLELSPFRHTGFFAEATCGYSPAFGNSFNLENAAVRFGVTLRTSFL